MMIRHFYNDGNAVNAEIMTFIKLHKVLHEILLIIMRDFWFFCCGFVADDMI